MSKKFDEESVSAVLVAHGFFDFFLKRSRVTKLSVAHLRALRAATRKEALEDPGSPVI